MQAVKEHVTINISPKSRPLHPQPLTMNPNQMDQVRQAVKEHVLNAGQALVVLGEFVRERDREECLVAIFSRIRGRKSALPRILLKHFDRMTVSLSIQQRLGVADAFDEFRPAGKYRLDLAKPDDREVLLRLLAIRDSGLFEGRECKWQFETPVYYPDVDHLQGSQPVDMDQYGEWIRAQVQTHSCTTTFNSSQSLLLKTHNLER